MTEAESPFWKAPGWPRALLREMVRRYSPSGAEGELAEYLADQMSQAGWDTRVDEVGNFVAQRGAGGHHLVFLGHIDTVEGWIDVREEDGLLYGRGTVDAKGPLAAFLAAATRAGPGANLKITCVGAVEEETSTSKGARHVVSRYRPDSLIIGEPSGWDTICIGYKGNCHVRLSLELPGAHGASGVASAGTRLCRFWQAVEAAAARFSRGDKAAERVIVEVRKFNTGSDGLTERATLALDIRTPPGHDAEGFKEALAQAAPEGGNLDILEELPAVRGSRSSHLVRYLRKAIRAMGGAGRFTFKMGTSDMNVAGPAWNCPMLAYGPGDPSLDHTPNEHISLEEFSRSVAILETLLRALPENER